MKLDLSKAYDRVDQCFLFKILKYFGFGERVIQLISQLISTPSIQIIVNGSPTLFFRSSRGLKQEDPISPILFVILDESLERYTNKIISKGQLKSARPLSAQKVRSHQQFADDTMLMGASTIKEAKTLKSSLNNYCHASGQLIKWMKISLFFLNTPKDQKERIDRILECQIGFIPSIYFGLPLCRKPPRTFWSILVDRFYKKIVVGKGSLLSQVGKIQLLKSSLQSGVEERKNISLIAWDKFCRPKNMGGLGLRNIKTINKALLAKQIQRSFWKTIEWNSIWKAK